MALIANILDFLWNEWLLNVHFWKCSSCSPNLHSTIFLLTHLKNYHNFTLKGSQPARTLIRGGRGRAGRRSRAVRGRARPRWLTLTLVSGHRGHAELGQALVPLDRLASTLTLRVGIRVGGIALDDLMLEVRVGLGWIGVEVNRGHGLTSLRSGTLVQRGWRLGLKRVETVRQLIQAVTSWRIPRG